MAKVNLGQLPNEILLEICHYFIHDELALCCLIRTSQKLGEAAKPVLTYKHLLHLISLAKEGFLCLDDNPNGTLQCLLNLQPMQMLHPSRNKHLPPEASDTKLTLRLSIQYKLRLFNDLKALHTLLLSLDSNQYKSFDIELRLSGDVSSDSGVGALKHTWFKLFTEVMNVVATKPSSTLTVASDNCVNWVKRGLGRPFIFQIEDRHDHRWIIGIITRLRSKGQVPPLSPEDGPLNPYTYPLRQIIKTSTIAVPSLPSLGRLEHFKIHSELLLRLPFFHWTTSVLSSSSITTLSFSGFQLTRYEWNYILSSISISTLSTLSLGNAHATAVDLLTFFLRHPSIMSLDFSRVTVFGSFKLPLHLRNKLLPNLTTLLADSWDLASFFSHPSTFPKLESITISTMYTGPFSGGDPGCFERRRLETVLHHFAERANNCVNSPPVFLTVRFGGSSLRTMLRNIHMHNNPGDYYPYFSASPHTDDAALVLDQLNIPNVSVLNLVIHGEPTSRLEHQRIYLDYFIKFLKMFTTLKHLTMENKGRIGGYASELYTDARRRAIWELLPTLETFDGECRVDGLTY